MSRKAKAGRDNDQSPTVVVDAQDWFVARLEERLGKVSGCRHVVAVASLQSSQLLYLYTHFPTAPRAQLWWLEPQLPFICGGSNAPCLQVKPKTGLETEQM
jgi:hypothetical protein